MSGDTQQNVKDAGTSRKVRVGSRGQEVDLGGLPGMLGYHLRCAQVAVFQHFNRALGGYEISPPQFGAMVLIDANPGISQSAVAEVLRFDRSTLVQIVDRLESRGFVVREPSEQDRRSHALRLTKDGSQFLTTLISENAAHERAVSDRLSEKEQVQLNTLLEKLHDPDAT